MELPYNVKLCGSKKYGNLLPYELVFKRFKLLGNLLKFKISKIDYIHLTDEPTGEGKIIAYIDDYCVWCNIKVFRYYVISFNVINDKEKIKEIEENLFS